MRALFALLLMMMTGSALAEDFDGSWRVPDELMTDPNECVRGDVAECLRMAFSREAGIREPDQTDAQRLAEAVKWHRKACAHAKKESCTNADRVQKTLNAAKALKSDAERLAFWCGDALDGAKRFTATSRTAPTIAVRGCKKAFPAKFQKSLFAFSASSTDDRGVMLLISAQEGLCPTLEKRPEGCKANAAKITEAKARTALAGIIGAALPPALRVRGDELTGWMLK